MVFDLATWDCRGRSQQSGEAGMFAQPRRFAHGRGIRTVTRKLPLPPSTVSSVYDFRAIGAMLRMCAASAHARWKGGWNAAGGSRWNQTETAGTEKRGDDAGVRLCPRWPW